MEDKLNTPWRKMTTAIYAPPNEGKVYGTLDVDVTDALHFIQEQKKKGKRITITHLVAAAIGRALKYDVPEINAFIHRGKLIPREDVIVTVAVNIGEGGEMSNVRIRQAHYKTIFEVADEITEKVSSTRSGSENLVTQNKYTLSKIPWPFRRWVFRLLKWITNELGIELKSLGLTHNAFGSILLSNIGTHELTTGMAALFPASKLPAVIIMGKVEEKPVVRNGQIVIRTMLPFTGTFDHRIMDGYHIGKFAAGAKKYLENPEQLAMPPEEATN